MGRFIGGYPGRTRSVDYCVCRLNICFRFRLLWLPREGGLP